MVKEITLSELKRYKPTGKYGDYKLTRSVSADNLNDSSKVTTYGKEEKKQKLSKKKFEKVLGSAKAKLPSYSAKKVVMGMGREAGALVREVENPYANPPQDNRSLYFRESYKSEKQKRFGGFI